MRAFHLALAILLTVLGASSGMAQELIPNSPSAFGAPSVRLPGEPAEQRNRPTLPSPADLPDDPAQGNARPDPATDLAFGAFQRGFYATAMREAMKRLAGNPKDGPAMTLVGELYAQGLGVKPSASEAARWFQLGADSGNVQAMFELGVARMKGDGVPQDRVGAKAMFEQAGAHDHAGALFYLGVMALQNNGVVPDYKTAGTLFQRAGDLGNPEAQYALALMYRNGTGVTKDDAKAAVLMKQAADNDNVAASVEYAIMLFNGVGTPKDESGAARLFIKAAGHNNAVAQDRAARLYVAGRGVKKDIVEGMKWHLLSRAAGLKDEWLDSEMNRLTPEQREAVDTAVRRYIGS